jgi:hypothetical protein
MNAIAWGILVSIEPHGGTIQRQSRYDERKDFNELILDVSCS